MNNYTICSNCHRKIFFSGGHYKHCPIGIRERAAAEKIHEPTACIDDEGFDEYQFTGGLTESEFFGGDIGDK
jgi:hypothetical protein